MTRLLPGGGDVTVDLSTTGGRFQVEWIHPVKGTITGAEPVAGGGKQVLKAPFSVKRSFVSGHL